MRENSKFKPLIGCRMHASFLLVDKPRNYNLSSVKMVTTILHLISSLQSVSVCPVSMWKLAASDFMREVTAGVTGRSLISRLIKLFSQP